MGNNFSTSVQFAFSGQKGEDYENRVETNPHQMITASKAKKQHLKNVLSNSKTKTWMC